MVFRRWFFSLAVLGFLAGQALSGSVINFTFADESPRARLGKAESSAESSATLPSQPRFTVITAKRWEFVADRVSAALNTSGETLKTLFGAAPAFSLSVQLLDEESFYSQSGAPAWTNAMYFDGRILIPVVEPIEEENIDNILRSVRHEYTHAYVSAAAAGKCPGWLDEGLAQWFEGPVNPLLEDILARYMKTGTPIPMALLQGGFTKLDNKIVGAAYGQSLFAANSLLRTFHARAMANYFRLLRGNQNPNDAFKAAFGMNERDFELRLGEALNSWAIRYEERKASAHDISQVSMYQQMR